ncbi:hypothetical protein HUG10_18190 [Halorarum halophilum]|uniref:Uncharacterized protein n=1 Tax=Halorarum halophilum TaxID=2743090 RepID=A0A7D5GNH2_9EURY|nr:hypothetical protein [Halobaculum halophilum]QLG29344.1 hypothetical protein HUG10_18190 [Halobaculum halophilum]
MSVTVNVAEDRTIRLTEQVVGTRLPDTIAFTAKGTLTMTEELLGAFEGTTLTPGEVSLSVDGSRTVDVDLSNGASLRLETVDVGVETPDPDDLVPGADSIGSAAEGAPNPGDATPGAIAFTVEGVIRGVPGEAFAAIAGGTPAIEALTFSVEDSVRSDGGSGDDVMFEFALLGFEVSVRRNGTIAVGTRGTSVSLDTP